MTGEVAEITLMTEGFRRAQAPGSSNPELVVLIERARSGDAAAFEEIVVCHQRGVLATAWRMLGSQDESQDAAQEVFLRAYRYLGSFRTDQDFSGWLYRITVNVCRDAGRKRTRLPVTSLEEERESRGFDAASSAPDAEAAAIRAEQMALVAEALDGLTRKEREALVLRDLEGLSTEEVARILGSTQATVRSQICAARAKIKRFHERALRRAQR